MKTFQEFVSVKETAAMDIGRGVMGSTSLNTDQTGMMKGLFKASRVAAAKAPGRLLSCLQSIARTNPDVQAALDEMNPDELNAGGLKSSLRRSAQKGLKLGGNPVDMQDTDQDVVVPNSADSASGQLP